MARICISRISQQEGQKRRKSSSLKLSRGSVPSSPHAGILALQQTVGNRAVSQLLRSPTDSLLTIQAKLTIAQAENKYEREADRVAEQIMQMPDTKPIGISKSPARIQRKCPACNSSGKLCPKCAAEEQKIQRRSLASTTTPSVRHQSKEFETEAENLQLHPKQNLQVTPNFSTALNLMRSSGQLLPASVRTFYEPRFGYDFSDVRVHTGTRAAGLARQVNARAFTVGRDIVFGAREYAPETRRGQRLLAHELTHVLQQTGSPATNRLALENLHTNELKNRTTNTEAMVHGLGHSSWDLQAPPKILLKSASTYIQRQTDKEDRDRLRYRCTQLGCSVMEHCNGNLCIIENCGRGSCRNWLCRKLGLENLLVRAWCTYGCVDGGAAMVFYSALGNWKFGPYCLGPDLETSLVKSVLGSGAFGLLGYGISKLL